MLSSRQYDFAMKGKRIIIIQSSATTLKINRSLYFETAARDHSGLSCLAVENCSIFVVCWGIYVNSGFTTLNMPLRQEHVWFVSTPFIKTKVTTKNVPDYYNRVKQYKITISGLIHHNFDHKEIDNTMEQLGQRTYMSWISKLFANLEKKWSH